MIHRSVYRVTLGVLLVTAMGVAACSPEQKALLPGAAKTPAINAEALNRIVDASFGGQGTCLTLTDRATGAEVYVYGSNAACMRPLPPCSTFKIANSLIGLDEGVIKPDEVIKWDGTPQTVKSWETDANLETAFKRSMVPWFQRVARQIGHDTYAKRLKAIDYGSADPAGPVDQFWLGPEVGGGLTISTRQQTDFLNRLYTGRLSTNPLTTATVAKIMIDESRGASVMSGKTGTCSSIADGSRSVGWWVGRLNSPERDLVFAVSMEGQNALPGRELQIRLKSAFAKAGLWPQG